MGALDLDKLQKLVPMLSSLSGEELQRIVSVSKIIKIPRGTAVFREGQASDGMYIIIRGTVRVVRKLEDGGHATLADLRDHQALGEMSILDSAPRSASAVAMSDCMLMHITYQGFNGLRRRLDPAAIKVIRALAPVLCERIRAINAKMDEIFMYPERVLDVRKLHGGGR